LENWKIVKANLFIVLIFLYTPLVVMIIMSFDPRTIISWPPPSLTTYWYKEVISDVAIIRPFVTSVNLGIIASLASGILGVMIALAIVREFFWGKELIRNVVLAPMLIPQVVTGIALLALFRLLGGSQGWVLLIIGHTLITLPYAVVVISAQLYGFNRHLEEAAQDLGAAPLKTFSEITLPLILPGIIAGILFSFAVSLQEVPATLSWVTPVMTTIALTIYQYTVEDLSPRINVIGVIMIMMSITVGALSSFLRNKKL
jgi:spermidine/putrescine transport system permease protein